LNQDPKPASELVEELPHDLERTINRCLRKNPAQRLQHMDDVETLLEELKEEPDSGKLSGRPCSVIARRNRSRWIVTVASLVVAAAAATWWLTRSAAPPLQFQAEPTDPRYRPDLAVRSLAR